MYEFRDSILETLQQIGGYLHDTHLPSLHMFGLASKISYTATLRSVFREVHLTVCSRKVLQYHFDALAKLLSDIKSVQYVCERIAYSGPSPLTKSLVRLNSLSLLNSSRSSLIQTGFETM
jgi:hypothetical protein